MSPKSTDPKSTDETAGGPEKASKRSKSDLAALQADVAATRDEFAATLDAIEDKLNPKTQFRRARGAISKIVSRSKE